jgi:hypothetical protein
MKKRMFVTMLISMVVMMCNAQYITKISERDGVIYLSNGATVSYETVAAQMAAQGLRADQLRPGETLQFGAMRQNAENYTKEIERRGYNTPANIYGSVYGVGVYGGVMPVFGTNGKSFSIGNQHWGFSTSTSNWGGYKTSSTGLRIGSFQVGGSTSGFVGLDSPSYTNQKNNAKKAAARYNTTRSNSKVSGNSRSTRTTTTSNTAVKSDTIDDVFGF